MHVEYADAEVRIIAVSYAHTLAHEAELGVERLHGDHKGKRVVWVGGTLNWGDVEEEEVSCAEGVELRLSAMTRSLKIK